MIKTKTKNIKISKWVSGALVLFGFVFLSAEAMATSSGQLFITSRLAECTYPQKRGGGPCLEKMNAKSCMNTTPFSPIGSGVTSEMCGRGKDWCDRNDPRRAHKRCQNVDKGIVKNHEGYDMSAACGSSIFAPCDGYSVFNGSSSTKPIKFTCTVCGKKYEYTFHHTKGSVGNGEYAKGKLIGWSGDSTGYPCHMHIEIRQNGVLMDPMNPGFDDEVCSCMKTEKVNRLECFDPNTLVDSAPVNTGYDTSLNYATVGAAAQGKHGESKINTDCVFSVVQARFHEKGCFACTPFRIMFNAASVMAKIGYGVLTRYMIILVMIGFAIWLGITVMKFVSNFEIRDPRNLIKILLHMAFKILIVVVLLMGPLQQILDMTINPIFSTGLKIAQMGSNAVVLDGPSECNIIPNKGVQSTAPAENSEDPRQILGVTEDGGLSPQMGNGILCTIKNIQDQVIDIFAISRVSWCLTWERGKPCVFGFCFPHCGFMLTSAGFFITGFLLLFGYPWLLVDSVLKMALTIALLPAALAGWPFKATSQYIKKLWGTFIDALFTYIFLSLIITVIAAIAKQYATEIITPEVQSNGIAWFATSALKIAFVCFLGLAVLREAKSFAKTFSKSITSESAPGFTQDIGAMTGSSAAAATKAAATRGASVAGGGIKIAAGTIGENASHLARKVKMSAYNKFGGGNSQNDDDGDADDGDDDSSSGSNMFSFLRGAKHKGASAVNNALDSMRTGGKTALGRGLNRVNDAMHLNAAHSSFTQDASGNIMQTKTYDNKDGSQTIVKTDDFATVTTRKGADGKETVLSVKPKRSVRSLVDKRGKIDAARLRAIQQNSLLSQKEKAMLIASNIHNERMAGYTGGNLDDSVKDRDITYGTNDKGQTVITISQTNSNNTKSVFTISIQGNRVMNSVTTSDNKGNSISYTTDGIVQKIVRSSDGVRSVSYSVSDKYSGSTRSPIHTDGSVSDVIGRNNVLFSDDELKEFGRHVANNGFSSAYASFTAFK